MSKEDLPPSAEYADPKGCLARVVWMLFGNLLLAVLVLSIARVPPWTPSWLDVVFWFVVLGAIAARYVDVTKLDGQTVKGAPATMTHVRRYAALLAGIALTGWAAAHSVQI
jgi:hypothetical protein